MHTVRTTSPLSIKIAGYTKFQWPEDLARLAIVRCIPAADAAGADGPATEFPGAIAIEEPSERTHPSMSILRHISAHYSSGSQLTPADHRRSSASSSKLRTRGQMAGGGGSAAKSIREGFAKVRGDEVLKFKAPTPALGHAPGTVEALNVQDRIVTVKTKAESLGPWGCDPQPGVVRRQQPGIRGGARLARPPRAQ